MARLNIAPTKSNYLSCKGQLAFAEEGYELLEQKRQILILEMMSRLRRAQEVEHLFAEGLALAHSALWEATLDIGSAALERAALGAKTNQDLKLGEYHLMGLSIPRVTFRAGASGVRFGIGGTSASTDIAAHRFTELIALLTELAELQKVVCQLARELRKTQRRCNALSKIFIPSYRETLAYISSTLEERERESLTILKIIRDRLGKSTAETAEEA